MNGVQKSLPQLFPDKGSVRESMRFISVHKDILLVATYGLLIAWGLMNAYLSESVPTFAMPVSKKIILIDAGHGGTDPGKVSGKVLEKEINLSIAQKVQAYLEEGGATVLVTRIDDSDLASSKSGDMRHRKLTANTSKADIFVSIHQNSYTSSGVKGAQVFYFNQSDNSKRLAECIQTQMRESVDPSNKFLAKSNSNYYVLKQTTMPAVIVECGFLSNATERKKLTEDAYQEKVAWAIYKGIVNYFNEP